MGKLYVIGDRKTGVLFLKTDPLRSVIIPSSAIRAYAKAQKIRFEEAFGRVGAVAKFLANKGSKTPKYPDNSPLFRAVGELIAGGERLTDADFCFVAELSADASKGFAARRFSAHRFSAAPIAEALSNLSGEAQTPGDTIPVGGFDGMGGARKTKR